MNALPPVHVVVLISGSGTNLQALLDATATPGSPLHGRCRVVGVVSNRKAAFGLERAARAGVPTRVLTLKSYRDAGRSRLDYDRDLAQLVMVEEWGAQVVVLAGFMHIVSQPFLDALPPGRVINLHPALPGEFDGVRAIERAFEAYQAGTLTRTGVMVHRVIPDVGWCCAVRTL